MAKIEKVFSDRVGGGNGVSFKPLKLLFGAIDKIYSDQLIKLGHVQEEASGTEAAPPGVVAAKQPATGEISSRQDVVATLDRICDYYARHEPSSPLPLLLQRCKRLVTASFLEIIQDVIPEAMSQAEAIGGRRPE